MAVTEQEQVDLGALEADARRTLEELQESRARLSLDALTDSVVASELASVESSIRSCQGALERLALAGAERERREVEAREAAAAAVREAAFGEARRLQAVRERRAQGIDEALSALAGRVRVWLEVCAEQARALEAAGRRESASAGRMRVTVLDGAFRAHLAGLPLQLEGSMPVHTHVPLARADARPCEPLEGK